MTLCGGSFGSGARKKTKTDWNRNFMSTSNSFDKSDCSSSSSSVPSCIISLSFNIARLLVPMGLLASFDTAARRKRLNRSSRVRNVSVTILLATVCVLSVETKRFLDLDLLICRGKGRDEELDADSAASFASARRAKLYRERVV